MLRHSAKMSGYYLPAGFAASHAQDYAFTQGFEDADWFSQAASTIALSPDSCRGSRRVGGNRM
jgi:hypothetical protein